MKTRNKLLTLLILSAGAATTTALINKAIKLSATSRNVLGEPEALCYKWRLGNIHYTCLLYTSVNHTPDPGEPMFC